MRCANIVELQVVSHLLSRIFHFLANLRLRFQLLVRIQQLSNFIQRSLWIFLPSKEFNWLFFGQLTRKIVEINDINHFIIIRNKLYMIQPQNLVKLAPLKSILIIMYQLLTVDILLYTIYDRRFMGERMFPPSTDVCLFRFYGISTFVGYLMPNPFLYK